MKLKTKSELEKELVKLQKRVIDLEKSETQGKLTELEYILNTSPIHIASIDINGKYTSWNRASEDIFGFTAEEVIGKLTPNRFHRNDKEAKAVIDTVEREGKFDDEITFVHRDGSEFSAHLLVSKTVDFSGNHIGYTGVAVDISKRKQAEGTQLVLYNIAEAVNTAKNLDELYKIIHKQLGTIIDTTNFYIANYNEDTGEIIAPYFVDEIFDDKPPVKLQVKGFTAYVIRNKKSLFLTKEKLKKLIELGEIAEREWKSKIWLGVPLIIENKVVGALAVLSYREEFLYTKKDLSLLEFVSDQIAMVIKLKQVQKERENLYAKSEESRESLLSILEDVVEKERTLRESEEKFRILVQYSPLGIFKANIKGNIEVVNPSLLKILGSPSEEETKKINLFTFPLLVKSGISGFVKECIKKGESTNREFLYRSKWGKEVSINLFITPVQNDLEQFIGVQGIIEDITDRKRAEEKYIDQLKNMIDLGISMRVELKLENLLQNICDMIVKSLGWRQVILSLRDYNTGTSRPVAVGGYDKKTVKDIMSKPPIPIKGTEKFFRDEFKISHSYYIDHTNWEKLKKYSAFVVITPVSDLDPGGWDERDLLLIPIQGKQNILGFISVDNPVSGNRPTEEIIQALEIFADQAAVAIKNAQLYEELQDSEKRFQDIAVNTGDWIWETDEKGCYTYSSPIVKQILGYENIEVLGKHFYDFFVPEEHVKLKKAALKEFKQKKYIKDFINRNVHKDGSIVILETSGIPLLDDSGSLLGYRGIDRDITERKQTEEALIISEERYRKFFMEDITGDYLTTREGKIIDCNPQFLNIYGFKSLEQAQKYDATKLHKSQAAREKFIKILEKNKILYDHQSDQYKVNGEKIIIKENVVGEFDEGGKLINIRGYLYDITEQVKAEKELVKLSIAVEQSPVSIVITDLEGRIEYVNPTFEKLTGYSLDEAIGLKPSILKSGVTSDSEYRKLWETISNGKVWAGELLNKKKNGELYWESVTISPVKDKKGKITNYLAIKEDITEQKSNISELMDREEKYRTLTQNLNIGVYRSTPGINGIFLEANPAFLKMFGFRNRNELERFIVADLYSDPYARQVIEEKLRAKGFLMNEEIQLRKKDGTLFYASESATAAKDELGKITHYDGIIEDITERKETREDLKQREEKFRLISEITSDVLWDWNSDSHELKFSEKFHKLVGCKLEEVKNNYDFFASFIHQDDRPQYDKVIDKMLTANEDNNFSIEYRIIRKDGEIIYLLERANVIRDSHGNATRMVGAISDITEQKKMLDQIIQERDKSQLYLDIAGVMFLALNRNGNIVLANQKTCEILEAEEKEIIGKNWFDNYIPSDIRPQVKELFNTIMNGKGKFGEYNENEIITNTGERRLISWHNSVLKDKSGTIIGVISSGLDITDSRAAEELQTKLYEISLYLTESLDIDIVLNRMSKQARTLLKCRGVMVYMLEEDKKTLNPVVAYDPPYTKQILAVKVSIDNSLTGQAIKAKTGKIFNYPNNVIGAFQIPGTPKEDTDNIIVSPLLIDGKIIGALTLVRSEMPFTNHELSIVNTFAAYASTAIKNANSHNQLQHEITERMQIQALLKESHDRYESIFDGTEDGIVYSDWKGNILSVNSAFSKLTGIKRDDIIGQNGITLAKQLIPKQFMPGITQFINNVLKGVAVRGFPFEYNNKSLELHIQEEKGKPGITVMIRDVTELNKTKGKIILHQKNLQSLTNELTMAEEKTRRRLAITLHDKLGQSLILAKFKINELTKQATDSKHKKVINEITSFIEDAINESRNITYELSPTVLYEMGLISAISWKLDEIEKSKKIRTSLLDQSKSYEIGKRKEIILYRTICELLQNIIKHAKAKNVNVAFRQLKDNYRITVSDDGTGFDLKAMREKAVAQKKFGLFSIMERIKYIGGEVNINSVSNKGTKVIIDLPKKN
ncbi:PAS domain S-box protein [bacterium]|nr:PAS domain S-box protein [bacterium]